MHPSHTNMDTSTFDRVRLMIDSHTREHRENTSLIRREPSCYCKKLHRSNQFELLEGAMKTLVTNPHISSVYYYTEKSYHLDGTKEKKNHFLLRLPTGTFWKVIMNGDVLLCFQQIFYYTVVDTTAVTGGGGAGASASSPTSSA